jgi:nucleotide-binding universal stress UspA family protein
MAERIKRSGVAAHGIAVSGRPTDGIVRVADEVDADLIVMSSHVRGGPLRTVLGSVADDVIRKSRRPVLVMRRSIRESPVHTTADTCGPEEGRSVSC